METIGDNLVSIIGKNTTGAENPPTPQGTEQIIPLFYKTAPGRSGTKILLSQISIGALPPLASLASSPLSPRRRGETFSPHPFRFDSC